MERVLSLVLVVYLALNGIAMAAIADTTGEISLKEVLSANDMESRSFLILKL